MSLLPPSLSAPAPAQTGNASSASSTSAAASSRGDESSQGEAPSFGDVLSRSLAASGESSAKTGGKPAAPVPVKRAADEKKPDTPEAVNTAALLFVPLETRIAKTAAAGNGAAAPTVTAAGANAASAASASTAAAGAATPPAELPADPAAPATQAANDAGFAVDAESQAPQALLASGLPAAPATPAKDRALATADAALPPAGDEPAIALPAGKVTGPAGAPNGGQAEQFSGRDGRPGGEAQEILGTSTRTDAKPGAAKYAATAANEAADKATDKAAVSAAVDASPAAAGQRSGVDASAAGPSFTVSAAAAPLHANASASSPAPAAAPAQAALTPEVGSGEWGKALGQHMVHMGKAGEQVAELQLNPPGLGPLKVTLSMNDNQVQALFVSAHSSVRAAVEAALPQLRSTLADSGINLGEASVNSGSQQQPAFAQNQNGQPGQPGARGRPGYPAPDAGPLAAPASELPARGSATGVDTYA
jgi:flagellar hook-length control protein FliK